jgi:SAM-dependent methyltransferase
MKLHLGCGHIIKKGWINHDIVQLPGVDIVHNLTEFPWPWDDGIFDEIYMDNVLEHLPETTQTLEELWRIMKPGGTIFIGVPYWNSFEAWGDPTHERLFSEELFEFYDPTTWRGANRSYYSKAKFKIEEIGFFVNFFKPLVRGTRGYRFERQVTNPTLKALIRIPATYFCNIIHGLGVRLRKIDKIEDGK